MHDSEAKPDTNRIEAQESADRIRMLRQELNAPDIQSVLALTPEQQARFDEWSRAELARLAAQFDVDTSSSQKRVSWGMRVASTLGGIAICAAAGLFFFRYWGYLETPAQVAIVAAAPVLALAGTEYAASREQANYFTGLLALVAFASFFMNLSVLGGIFSMISTERALLAWGAFAMALAYRYGLRPHLVLGLLLLISYVAAAWTASLGHPWLDFLQSPEPMALVSVPVFGAPSVILHRRNMDFPLVYRMAGAAVFFVCLLSLAGFGNLSYVPMESKNVERLYELIGLVTSAAAIWHGIARGWNGLVNLSSCAFVVFLFTRLYRWWWDWMPKYLFFTIIGAIGIGLVLVFKRLRARPARRLPA